MNQIESSSSNGSDPVWKHLWNLNIPPKAKNFLWRAAWDILPHGSNLRKKGVDHTGKCQRCGLIEDNNHVLRDCSWSRQVWSSFGNAMNNSQYTTFREWLAAMMDHKDRKEVELFGTCAWQIWSARNDLQFEKIYVAPDMCYKRAADMLSEYHSALVPHQQGTEQRRHAKWVPPNAGVIKINVDAAVNTKNDRIGHGLVARNSEGEVILAASRTSWPVISAERAELGAFQWAVDMAQEQSWNNVIVEGDAQVVVNALNGKISRSLHAQVVVENILHASARVPEISFNFCFREANNVAHRLAKWAVACVCSSVWLDSGPSWISDTVFSDLHS